MADTPNGETTYKQTRNRSWGFVEWKQESWEKILTKMTASKAVEYCVAADEVGDEGKHHLQGHIYFKNAKTMTACKKWLGSKTVHLTSQRGSRWESAAYIFDPAALGKDKEPGFIVLEEGLRPVEGAKSQWDYIISMLENGATDHEIMKKYPEEFARNISAIGRLRMVILGSQLNTWRTVEVEYIHGATGTGKTRGVLEAAEHPSDVYRVTDYKNPFDTYNGQPTILFEEFRSSLKIEQMLNYLDGYFCELPCRYTNKVSGWTKVVFCTNLSLDEQYGSVQVSHPETWLALLRRIDKITHLHMGSKGNAVALDPKIDAGCEDAR